MTVGVIGAGAAGAFLGSVLARDGHQVAFLVRQQSVARLRLRGVSLASPQFGAFHFQPRVSADPDELGKRDVVLIAVKMFDLEQAARTAARLVAPHGTVVTIQPGFDAGPMLASAVGSQAVVVGAADLYAQRTRLGSVGHLLPMHQVRLAPFSPGATDRSGRLLALLRAAGITASSATDSQSVLWEHLARRVPFATLTAGQRLNLGNIMDIPTFRMFFRQLTEEAIAVAEAWGHSVARSARSHATLLETVAGQAPRLTSPLSRDLRAGKWQTELAWLTGELVRRAELRQVPIPVHRTLFTSLQEKVQRNRAGRPGGQSGAGA